MKLNTILKKLTLCLLGGLLLLGSTSVGYAENSQSQASLNYEKAQIYMKDPRIKYFPAALYFKTFMANQLDPETDFTSKIGNEKAERLMDNRDKDLKFKRAARMENMINGLAHKMIVDSVPDMDLRSASDLLEIYHTMYSMISKLSYPKEIMVKYYAEEAAKE